MAVLEREIKLVRAARQCREPFRGLRFAIKCPFLFLSTVIYRLRHRLYAMVATSDSLFVDLSSVFPCLASLDVAVFDVSWRRQASTFPSNIEPLTWSPDPLDCPAIANP